MGTTIVRTNETTKLFDEANAALPEALRRLKKRVGNGPVPVSEALSVLEETVTEFYIAVLERKRIWHKAGLVAAALASAAVAASSEDKHWP